MISFFYDCLLASTFRKNEKKYFVKFKSNAYKLYAYNNSILCAVEFALLFNLLTYLYLFKFRFKNIKSMIQKCKYIIM